MATFAAATFIPQIQPYQPDLNLYSNIIQNKQTQYDSNWKSLNKIYGQYFYADLTRDDNIKKKDYLLDQINFNLKRVAGLDLSLQQNVSQATQIFKPFYEDKGLMKDMAWTKNYNMQVGTAQALQGSADEKRRGEFWDAGLRFLQYKRDEFKEASADKALAFENIAYTPYVNVQNKALELAKSFGDIQSVDWSDDGRYIVTKTNGEQLEEPLQHLFEANLGSNAQIQSVYQTQAYVNRKDYAYSNAAQFNGDKNAAEMKYLEENFNVLKEQSRIRYKNIEAANSTYDARIKDLQKQIADGTAGPDAENLLNAYLQNKDINTKVLERAKKDFETISNGESSTATTTTGFKNPYGDLESLRYKVDNGVASMLMQKDFDEAAHSLSKRGAKTDVKADPFAVLDQQQQYRLEIEQIRAEKAAEEARKKRLIEAGTHYEDENGNLVEDQSQNIISSGIEDKGNVTDEQNVKVLSQQIQDLTRSEYLDPAVTSYIQIIGKALGEGKLSEQQANSFFGGTKYTYKQFKDNYNRLKNNPGGFRDHFALYEKGEWENINKKIGKWVEQNRELDMFTLNGQKTQLYEDYVNSSTKITDYVLYQKADIEYNREVADIVAKVLKDRGFANGHLLYDKNGIKRSKEEYYALLDKEGILTSTEARIYNNRRRNNNIEGQDVDWWDWLVPPVAAVYKIRDELGDSEISNLRYENILEEADKIASSSKYIKKAPPRISVGPTEAGTGTYAFKKSTITVNPRGTSKGKLYFNEIIPILNSTDYGDFTKISSVSIGGITKTAKDKFRLDGSLANSLVQDLIRDFNSAKNPKSESKLKNFTLESHPIAANNSSLGAITIKPNREWIKDYVDAAGLTSSIKQMAKEDLDDDDLSDSEIKSWFSTKLANNGINFFIPVQDLKRSSLYRSSYESPLEAYVNYAGSYTLNNIGGDPNASYKITKNKNNTGDYSIKATYPSYDPNTKKTKMETYTATSLLQQGNLAANRDNFLAFLKQVQDANNQIKNQYK
jgi:hypothetical protein